MALTVVATTLAGAPAATAHESHDLDLEPLDSGGSPLFLAHDATLFDDIAAPFACGSEWSGQTRPGHGQNDWNLDFNRTSLDFGEDRQHDLGQPLFAQADGVVTYIGWQVNAGTYLDIDYGDYAARYIHLVDDSVVPEVGDAVTQGETIALLGDTGNTPGFAHLHLEYWDSRGFDAARIWELKQAGQPQTEVTFDGNVIDPGEVIVSSNCVGAALAAGDPSSAPGESTDELDPLASDALLLMDPVDGLPFATERLSEHAVGSDPLAPEVFAEPEGLLARIDGTDLAAESVLVVAHRQSTSMCDPDLDACVSATRNGAPTAAVLEILDDIAAASPRRTVLIALVDDADEDGTALAALLDSAGADADRDALMDTIVAAIHLGPLGEAATLPLRNDTLVISNADRAWSELAPPPGQPDDLRWWNLGDDPAAGANLAALRAHGAPVIAVQDPAGPCATGANPLGSTINIAKLQLQIDAIAAAVIDLASADAAPALSTASADETLIADATALVELIEHSGRTLGSSVLSDFLADVPDPVPADTITAVRAAMAEEMAALIDATCSAHAAPAPFTDLRATSFAITDVGLLFDLGITVGTSTTTYSPTDSVTREQMAAFLARIWRLLHPDAAPTEPMPFDDVDDDSFAFDDIRLLFELGITNGTSPTTYSPDDPVTREQMGAFLARVWRLLFPDLDPSTIDPHPFDDVDLDSFAFDDISLIYAIEVTVGTSPTTFSPDDSVTREQMAAFLARVLRRHATDVAAEDDPG
ncbi:MAG: S-layer homology domain-containing protein [Actinomycetota bacterium]